MRGPRTARARPRRVAPSRLDLPADVRDADYVDVFEVAARPGDPRTPQDLARSGLEEVPGVVRALIRFAHAGVLRLDLAPAGTPDHVAGWRVTHHDRRLLRLEATSPLLAATILVTRDQDVVRLVTALRYARARPAAALWLAVGVAHRRLAPVLMSRASAAG